MNVIPFVLAILLVLSYSLAASMQGRLLSHRNQKAYLALRGAELDILRKSEERQFKTLPGDKVKRTKKSPQAKNSSEPKEDKPPDVNAHCARLNIYPLIMDGATVHPALYETAAKLVRIFYQAQFFKPKAEFEYKILDAIIAGAKEKMENKTQLALETIAVKDQTLQPLYYTLLKGTKRHELSQIGYPPLIDYLKIEKSVDKICLFHCHPDMLTVFFGSKTAPKLYQELHTGNKASMELEAILNWASDPELHFVTKEVWDLIDFKRPSHGKAGRLTLLGEEDGVLVRKNVALRS